MKPLQNKMKRIREELTDLRFEKAFKSLTDEERKVFYDALFLINRFENFLIFNYIIPKKEYQKWNKKNDSLTKYK